ATDPQGRFGLHTREITVGNTAPEVTLDVPDGAIFKWGDSVPVTVAVQDAEDGSAVECSAIDWTFGLGHNTHAHPIVTGTGEETADGCGFTIKSNENAVEHGEGEKI